MRYNLCYFGIIDSFQPCKGKHILVDFDVSLIQTTLILQAIQSCQRTLNR